MKTEFTDVSETRKHLTFEVPSDAVEAEIGRVAHVLAAGPRPRLPAGKGCGRGGAAALSRADPQDAAQSC
ncbi:MAG: hypothetical protein R2752_01645 [Vicinamibacterales bacterium]